MALTQSLNSTFNDNAQYSSSATVTRAATQVTIPGTLSYLHCWSVNAAFDFTDSFLSAEIAPVTGTGRQYFMYVELDNFDNNNYCAFILTETTLVAEKRIAGVQTTVTTAAFSAINHRYWKISHSTSTGNVVFAVSPDGAVWTTYGTTTAPTWNIASVGARFNAGRYSGTDGSMVVSHVNLVVGPVSANAENAAGVATANPATPRVRPSVANAPAGSAVAGQPTTKIAPASPTASGVASALNASVAVHVNAFAETATADATANGSNTTIRANAVTASATGNGQLPNPGIAIPSGVANAQALALDPHTMIKPTSVGASAVASGLGATIGTAALAETATAVATAHGPALIISPNALPATAQATATAEQPGGSASSHASTAAGTAIADDVQPSIGVSPDTAVGVASSPPGATRVAPVSPTATATGSALDPEGHVSAQAEAAHADATAFGSSTLIRPTAVTAEAGASSHGQPNIYASSDVATADAAALEADVSLSAAPLATVAQASGLAFNASVLVVDNAALPVPRPHGWRQYQAIITEARQTIAFDQAQPPRSCPNCGGTLNGVRGVLHCRFDGWTSAT